MKREVMKRNLIIVAVIAIVVSIAILTGCDDNKIGGPCPYTDYPGIATIKTVATDNSSGRQCESAVIITYDFAPDDPSAVARYRFPKWPDTNRTFDINGMESIPSGWTDKEGITEGSEHRCVRREIRVGTCNPLIFGFSDVDVSDWPDYCD
jgi:hypothetical protein